MRPKTSESIVIENTGHWDTKSYTQNQGVRLLRIEPRPAKNLVKSLGKRVW